MAMHLEPADIVLHRAGGDFLGGLISAFTSSPYSHAELYAGDGWSISAEAKGISYVTCDRGGAAFLDVVRLRGGLSDAQRLAILASATATLRFPYEYALLFGFPFLSRRAVLRRARNDAFICAEHVAWCYRQAGIVLVPGRPESIITAADLAADTVEHVASWAQHRRVEDAVLNRHHPLQPRRSRLAEAVIARVANPHSSRDDEYRQLADERARAHSTYAAHDPTSGGPGSDEPT
jgi:hypothetical protein